MIPQVELGSTGVKVGRVGHGMMMMTWVASGEMTSDELAFESIITAVDAGANLINSGAFYGPPGDPLAGIKLLRRFFDAHPDYVDKVYLSVKGGGLGPAQTDEFLRNDVDEIVAALGPRKKLDLYEIARNFRPVEESVALLAKLIQEGKFRHIGMSEVSAATLRKAHAVHPIAAVEVEVSVWALEEELYKVIKTAEELDISVVGYSPLGRGLLVTTCKTADDIPEGDIRKGFPRFSKENFPINLKLVAALKDLAGKRGIPASQLAIAYILKLSPKVIAIPGSSKKERVLENIGSANVAMSDEDFDAINKILLEFPKAGDRYGGAHAHMTWL